VTRRTPREAVAYALSDAALRLLEAVEGLPADDAAQQIAALAEDCPAEALWERAFLAGVARAAADARRLAAGETLVAVRVAPEVSRTFAFAPPLDADSPLGSALLRAVAAAMAGRPGAPR
jgi:hypothetical protein